MGQDRSQGEMAWLAAKDMTDCRPYEASVIKAVEETDDSYEVSTEDSWCFIVSKEHDGKAHGVVPKVGDKAVTIGGLWRPVRGLAIGGTWIYYRTEDEERARFEARARGEKEKRVQKYNETGRATQDAEYESLPQIFKDRIERFRANNPDFRVEYESYELFCCTEAVKLANYLKTAENARRYVGLAQHETWKDDHPRWEQEFEEQRAIDKAAGLSHDHSGNTHYMAGALAAAYLERPEVVKKAHGALAALVGSREYGDMTPDEQKAYDAKHGAAAARSWADRPS